MQTTNPVHGFLPVLHSVTMHFLDEILYREYNIYDSSEVKCLKSFQITHCHKTSTIADITENQLKAHAFSTYCVASPQEKRTKYLIFALINNF